MEKVKDWSITFVTKLEAVQLTAVLLDRAVPFLAAPWPDGAVRLFIPTTAYREWVEAEIRRLQGDFKKELYRTLVKCAEALWNVPQVGQVYDQQHADTHLRAATLAVEMIRRAEGGK